MFAAIFAKMKAKQLVLRGAQNAMKSATHALQSYEDITGQKTLAKAYTKAGSSILGLPQQVLRVHSSVERTGQQVKLIQQRAEAMQEAAALASGRKPIPGKGMRGKFSATDVGAYKPQDYIGPIKEARGPLSKYRGMYVPPELYNKLKAKSPKPGRPTKAIKKIVERAAAKKVAHLPEGRIRRIIEV